MSLLQVDPLPPRSGARSTTPWSYSSRVSDALFFLVLVSLRVFLYRLQRVVAHTLFSQSDSLPSPLRLSPVPCGSAFRTKNMIYLMEPVLLTPPPPLSARAHSFLSFVVPFSLFTNNCYTVPSASFPMGSFPSSSITLIRGRCLFSLPQRQSVQVFFPLSLRTVDPSGLFFHDILPLALLSLAGWSLSSFSWEGYPEKQSSCADPLTPPRSL